MSTKLSMIANVASVYVPLRLESPIELVGSLRSVARRVQSVFPAKLRRRPRKFRSLVWTRRKRGASHLTLCTSAKPCVQCTLPPASLRSLCRGRNQQVADVVRVSGQTLPRGQWAKGAVKKAVQSKDGAVREIILRTKNRNPGLDVRRIASWRRLRSDDERRSCLPGHTPGD